MDRPLVLVFALWAAVALPTTTHAETPRDPTIVDEKATADPKDADQVGDWRLAIIPKITYTSDDGLGLGVRGTWYWYRFRTVPYKTAVSFQAWMTTRFVQHHFVRIDAIDALRLPFRLEAEIGHFQTVTQLYCGTGNDTTCAPDDARRAAEEIGLGPRARGVFQRRYYAVRYLAPYETSALRLRLLRFAGATLASFAAQRATFYQPGDLIDGDGDGGPDLFPYRKSRYDVDTRGGERGLVHVMQAGLVLDARDFEPAPHSGFAVESSLRSAQPFFGSAFAFVGGNFTARLFVPLHDHWTLAIRGVYDQIVGDPPLVELARVGGTVDYLAFGGMEAGRGVRAHRFIARTKTFLQHELRAAPWSISLWDQKLTPGFAFFLDAGKVADDPLALLADPFAVHVGAGVALRIAWNDAFVVRLDVAVSADESFRPAVYSGPNHPF